MPCPHCAASEVEVEALRGDCEALLAECLGRRGAVDRALPFGLGATAGALLAGAGAPWGWVPWGLVALLLLFRFGRARWACPEAVDGVAAGGVSSPG